jgi:4-aminobutyrate aminotransferase
MVDTRSDAPKPAGTTAATDPRAVAQRVLSPAMARYFERTWSHGDGHRLYDTDGRAYLDFATGIATTILGHRHPAVTAAVHAQVDRMLHVMSGLGYIEPVSRLAELLARSLPDPLDTVFFGNSGAEVIDGALKLARRSSGRPGIIAFQGGFHGRTYGALSITTSSLNYQAGHGPLLPGVHIAPYPSAYRDFDGDEEAATAGALAALERLFAETIRPSDVAAIVIEPILGEGGYIPAPLPFLVELRSLCDRHGILLVCDEVQTGYGRTGRMWGFEHAGIVPDIVCAAKGIANGLPLGALVSRRELQERWGRGAHGSTFGGNPVACAAGIAVLETVDGSGLVANAANRGADLIGRLRTIAEDDPRVGDVRGRGLMIGVELVRAGGRDADHATAEAVMNRCADLGLLLLTCGSEHNIVRWLAPLDVTAPEIEEGVAIFARALAAVA